MRSIPLDGTPTVPLAVHPSIFIQKGAAANQATAETSIVALTVSSDKAAEPSVPAAIDWTMNIAGGTMVPARARIPTNMAAVFGAGFVSGVMTKMLLRFGCQACTAAASRAAIFESTM